MSGGGDRLPRPFGIHSVPTRPCCRMVVFTTSNYGLGTRTRPSNVDRFLVVGFILLLKPQVFSLIPYKFGKGDERRGGMDGEGWGRKEHVLSLSRRRVIQKAEKYLVLIGICELDV